jgi:hypothetical protein
MVARLFSPSSGTVIHMKIAAGIRTVGSSLMASSLAPTLPISCIFNRIERLSHHVPNRIEATYLIAVPVPCPFSRHLNSNKMESASRFFD